MFKDVPNNVNFPKLEEAVIEFWREKEIFKRSIEESPKVHLHTPFMKALQPQMENPVFIM